MTRNLAILGMDADLVSHVEIARCFGLTKERVRQICGNAGGPTRTSRLIGIRKAQSQQVRADKARLEAQKAARLQEIQRLWKAGASFERIAKAWGFKKPTYRRGAALIYYLRVSHPEMSFPVRRSNHWAHVARVKGGA